MALQIISKAIHSYTSGKLNYHIYIKEIIKLKFIFINCQNKYLGQDSGAIYRTSSTENKEQIWRPKFVMFFLIKN